MGSMPNLYRYVDFIGGNILDASNVQLLQSILSTQPSNLETIGATGLSQVYQQGTLLNAVFNITGTGAGTVIVMTHANTNYPIFVLVNGQFESLGNTVTIAGSQPTSGAAEDLYLNWSLNIITSALDPTFVDGETGEPTIEAGQIALDVDWSDTSGASLDPSTQFAKNTATIILATFDFNASPTTVTYINGVFPYAEGNPNQAGLVALTDTSGIAVGTTDPRNSNERVPTDGSVDNDKISTPISSGTNSSSLPVWMFNDLAYTVGSQIQDSNGNIETVVTVYGTPESGSSAPTWNLSLGGQTIDNPGANQIVWINGGPASTTKYDPSTSGQAPNTDNLVYSTLKEKLTTFLDSVNTSINNVLIALTNHIGKALGTAETHPFPTAAQVGAAPASHVGLPLGLPTSHPALVNSDMGGFVVDELTGTISGDAYVLNDDSSTRKVALTHGGDVYSTAAGAYTASALEGDGATPDPNNGALTTLSRVAAILADHVGFNVTGQSPVANNPHNLHPGDIGAASQAYVDSVVASIIAAAQGYTTARTQIAVRKVTHTLAYNSNYGTQLERSSDRVSGTPPTWNAGFGGIQLPAASFMTYLIFTFGSTSGVAVLPMWQPANYYNLGYQIIDPSGYIQQVTSVGSAGYGISSTPGPPSWSDPTGTTSDGSGTTSITWTNKGSSSTLAGFEIAIGTGEVVYQGGPLSSQTGSPKGDAVPIPELVPANNSGIPWTYSKALAMVAGGTTIQHTDQDDIESIQVAVDPSTFQVYGFSRTSTHTPIDAGVANVFAIFYRQL